MCVCSWVCVFVMCMYVCICVCMYIRVFFFYDVITDVSTIFNIGHYADCTLIFSTLFIFFLLNSYIRRVLEITRKVMLSRE